MGSEAGLFFMYDLGVFFGFVAIVLAPCALALLTGVDSAPESKEQLRSTNTDRVSARLQPHGQRPARAPGIMIAPVRRAVHAPSVRAK